MSDKTTELNKYLSDKELLSLIEDTEKNMTAVAPPDLAQNVIDRIETAEAAREKDRRAKVIEYRQFCFKVGFGVAAAIAIIIVAPFVTLKLKPDMYQTGTVSQAESREDVLRAENIPTKDEVVKGYIPTKEEALDHDRITGKISGSHYISNFYNSEER